MDSFVFRLALIAAAVLSACKRDDGGRAQPGALPAEPAETGGAPSQQDNRSLALASVPGDGVVAARIARLQTASKAAPGNADNWVRLGEYWVRKARESGDPGYFLNASASAALGLELVPSHRGALGVRAMVMLNQHRFDEARELAESILREDRDDVKALGVLADALLELGETERSREAIDRMMRLKPDLPAYARASYMAWLHGRQDAALEAIRLGIDAAGAAADTEPRAWALVQAADIFWHRGDYEGADAGYDMALGVLPDYAAARVGRGRVCLARGDAARAAEHFRLAFRRSPSVEVADLLQQALTLGGNEAEAEQALREAERRGAAEPRALSLFYSARAIKSERALELARRERARRGDIYTEDALAWALYRAGAMADAAPVMARAVRHGTLDARLLFHHGAILVAGGKVDAGRAALRRALDLNPHFDVLGAREARRLLTESGSAGEP
jgi:tetratricopeptide (TPR) repeat protein